MMQVKVKVRVQFYYYLRTLYRHSSSLRIQRKCISLAIYDNVDEKQEYRLDLACNL